jgi:hypothetical protein
MTTNAPTITLGEQQAAAITNACQCIANGERLTVLTGAAGTGKSTTTLHLIARLRGEGHTVTPCAPTHKAAAVFAACIGEPVVTLASLICKGATEHADCPACGAELAHDQTECECGEVVEHAGELTLNPRDPGTAQVGGVLLIDESSMVGARTADDMWQALPAGCQVVAIGDPHQLPPVNDSAGFPEMDGSPFELTHVYRQAEASPVLTAATAIRQERVPFTWGKCGADWQRGEQILAAAGVPCEWTTLPRAAKQLAAMLTDTDGDACAIVGVHVSRVKLNDKTRSALGFAPRADGPQVGERVIAMATGGGLRNSAMATVDTVEPAQFGDDFGDGWTCRVTLADGGRREVAILRSVWCGIDGAEAKHRGKLPRSVSIALGGLVERDEQTHGDAIADALAAIVAAHVERFGEQPNEWRRDMMRARAAREVGAFAVYLAKYAAQVASGYAITCHKAQGSQFARVMIVSDFVDYVGAPAMGEPVDPDQVYRWSYTALTRACEFAVVVKRSGDDWKASGARRPGVARRRRARR